MLITAICPWLSQLGRYATLLRLAMNAEMKGFNALIIAPEDNVAVALRDISQITYTTDAEITMKED